MNIFDPHISGSLSVSGSGEISGDLTVLGTLFATVSGTTQNAVSASHAAMYLLTSSFQTFTGSYTTGAFTGSFKGDGSGLYNIPASGVTGLNLTRIADGSATASISSVDGLRINSNTEITGTLKVNNFNLGSNDIVEITLTDAGGKYYVNGVKNPRLSFIRGFKYRFYYNNINVHPLLFSLTDDGEHNGGTVYTTGVTTGSTPSFYVQIDVTDATASTLYYFCDHHVGMGNSISVYSDFLNAQSSVNLTNVDTGMFATTGSNNFTNIQRTSGSVVVTGSVDITGSITLNGQAIGTGKLDETVFNTYTSSNDGRVNSIETSTGSLNTFTSSINTTIKNKLDADGVISGSIQVQITGTTGYSTFSSSVSTSIGALSSSIETTTSGLSSSIGALSSSVATTTSGLSSSIGSISSSFSSTNDTQNNRLDSIETSTGSLNSFTSSIDTTIKNKLNTESVVSGSSQILITGTTGYSTFSSSVSTSIGALSSSVSTSIGSLSSSVATTTNDLSSSVALTTSGLTLSVSSLSSSVATTTSGLSSSIGSLSSSVATTDLNQNNRLDSIEGKTGSYATTGSNIFQGNQTITGSLYVSQDLIVAGSSSIQHISSSIVNIADNIITVNAQNPSIRFGGLAVIDSGSAPQVSGSMLFDSTNDQWIFVHQNQGTVTSSVLLMGPETYNNLGGESYLTQNRIPKGSGIEHLRDSNITDNGTKVSINSDTEVTGTLKVTGVIGSPTITAIETSTSSLNTFTSSLLTAIELTGSNLTVRGNLLVKGTTTNVNITTLDVDNNLINLNGSGASFAGLKVKDTTAPNQVSGSLLWDATNDYWIAGQLGSEQRLVRETEFNNAVTRIGNVETSTGSLNSFTSSINTTIKNKLNSDGVISGSSQVSFNGIADKPALVSGSSQITFLSISSIPSGLVSGSSQVLSGTGIWSGSAQLPSGVVSGSSQVLAGTTIHSGAFFNGISVVSGSGQISFNGITDKPTLVSGSSQITFLSISSIPSGLVSGSSQVLSGTGIWSGSAQLPSGVVSGSAQVVSLLPSGTVSGSSQITGIGNSQLTNSSFNIGTTSISLGRASAAQTLTGVSIDGNAATVTNGVYTSGDQTIGGTKTFSGNILMSAGYISGYVGSTGSGDSYAPFRFSQDYSGWLSLAAGTPGSNNGWGLFWAGNSGAQYGTNGTGGPGNIWSNSTNPNEYVFVGNGSTNMAVHGNTGNVWIAGNLTVAGGTITATTFSGNATSATTADQIDSIGFRNTNTSGVNANTLDSNGTTYVTNVDGSSTDLTGNSTDGALYSQIYSSSWQHQIYGDYRTGIMYARGKNNGTWQSWKRVALSNSTTFSSVTSLTFTHNLGTANLTAQVFDSNGDMFFPSNIRITSTQVIVTFASSRSGRLVVTG